MLHAPRVRALQIGCQSGVGKGTPPPRGLLQQLSSCFPRNAGFHASGLEPHVSKAICATWIN